MAPENSISPTRPRRRLGIWWRLWLILSGWWAAFALTIAITFQGWENGLLVVVGVILGYPVLGLLLGLSVSWVRKGLHRD